MHEFILLVLHLRPISVISRNGVIAKIIHGQFRKIQAIQLSVINQYYICDSLYSHWHGFLFTLDYISVSLVQY